MMFNEAVKNRGGRPLGIRESDALRGSHILDKTTEHGLVSQMGGNVA
jgi:hypothetical protein